MNLSNGAITGISIVVIVGILFAGITLASPQGEEVERLKKLTTGSFSSGGTKRKQSKQNKTKKHK
jgi:hypothetical protein